MAKLTKAALEELQEKKGEQLKEFLEGQTPEYNGEKLLAIWDEFFDEELKNTVVTTINGPSDDETNPVMPYEKIQAVVGDGGSWKWPRMWQRFDEIERRGEAYREGEPLNFNQPNKNPNIVSQRVLVVGGGPIGCRTAIELAMGGHKVTLCEKRREMKNEAGEFVQLGFTNRINRPHMWPFVRNDLAKLNGKELLSRQQAYPIFTEPETSSAGIDELQTLLIKNALMLGVDFRLGVGYVNAKINSDEDSLVQTWNCELKYDEQAAKKFGKSVGKNLEEFDCLVGCDGPRSTVRDTQAKYFGNVEKRKFMDCVGIVANVRKVPKKRLKEMGFEYGQEPGDMNRSKMVFKEFFAKIEEEADADIESLIYYKAVTHNYTILVPKRQDMIKHGLSGKVYDFHAAREGGKNEDKVKLKTYASNVLKAAGIPFDPDAPNGGFVDVPNDCMAFDFAECWNTKKSMHFELPPPGYSVEEDGEWEGKRLCPFVCLAGDALLEPFWPMGLGLKRGWQAIMDTAFAIDNLYNRLLYCPPDQDPEDWDWEQHYEAHMEQCVSNFEFCSRLQVAESLAKGEYDDKGPIMTQLKKYWKDADKPSLEVEIDPWTRYQPLEQQRLDEFKKLPKAERDAYMYPKVKRVLAMRDYYAENSKAGKQEVIDYKGKELISVNGKVVGGYKQAGKSNKNADGKKKKPAAAPVGARGKAAAKAKATAEPPAEA